MNPPNHSPHPSAAWTAVQSATGRLWICPRCAQAHQAQPLTPRTVARCVRCNAVMERAHRLSRLDLLALCLAAAIVFIMANTSDLIDIRLGGMRHHTTFLQALAHAWGQGEWLLTGLAGLTAVLAPALFIGLRLYLLFALSLGRRAPGDAACLRFLYAMSHWNTLEVLTISALLALVRIAALADALPGPGLLALGALTLLMAAIESAGLHHLSPSHP